MKKPIIFSLKETPEHPWFSKLYKEMGYEEVVFNTKRKIMSALKSCSPDVIVAQFIYAYESNYASNHISNLDSILITLQKHSDSKPKFIFLCYKEDHRYLDKLTNHYKDFSKTNHAILLPAQESDIRNLL